MIHKFINEIKTIDHINLLPSIDDLSSEQMVYSSDIKFTRKYGGKITNKILDVLLNNETFKEYYSKNKNVVIDTRVTMTMKGMFPSIPGWHCDDVPRSSKYDQPDLSKIDDSVQHFMVLISENGNSVSNTEFITENIEIDVDENNVWNSIDKHIEKHSEIKRGKLSNNDIIRFTQNAIHRAGKCEIPGWRLFFRLSLTHRESANKLRNQVQVYVDSNGW